MIVSTSNGKLFFEGDFGPCPEEGLQWPPFRNFGDVWYTYQILLDVKVENGFAIRTEPHPRFYTDRTDTCPIAVPALIRNWWPMMFFIVFKAPAEGRVHIFRPGEAFAQIIVIPEEARFDLVEMGEEESAERELQARRIHASRDRLSESTRWVSRTETVFDGTYRFMLRAAKALVKGKRRDDPPAKMSAAGTAPAALTSVIIMMMVMVMMIVMMVVVMIPPPVVVMMVMMVVVLGQHPSVHALAVRRQIPRRSRLGGREQYGRVGNWLQ